MNQNQPVPSLLIDQLINSASSKKQFEDIGYYFWRFRLSVFGYKLRPWTNYLITIKGIELDAFDTLVEMLNDSDKYGQIGF